MARRETAAELVEARVALAKARLALRAREAELAPAATDHVAALVRARPWRGVAVALGLGVALGLTRGRGVRALGAVVGPLGAALVGGALRSSGLGAASPASAVDAKIAELRYRSSAR